MHITMMFTSSKPPTPGVDIIAITRNKDKKVESINDTKNLKKPPKIDDENESLENNDTNDSSLTAETTIK